MNQTVIILLVLVLFYGYTPHGLSILKCKTITIAKVCPNDNVTFWLHTASHGELQIKDEKSSILNAPFVEGKQIVFLLHGFTGNRSHEPNPQIRPKYIRLNYNVISIDYGPVAPRPCYLHAVLNSAQVAKCAAEFINNIVKFRKPKITIADFHLIGFSLGGQIAGKIGTILRKMGQILNRVTGLDPAAPLYYLKSSYISKRSAKFVDAIHSNVGIEGKLIRVGHVDFYLNAFVFQKGCGLSAPCSHVRAPLCYAESIIRNETKGFYGRRTLKCNPRKLVEMGEYTPLNATGIYYVQTGSKPPYGLGKPC